VRAANIMQAHQRTADHLRGFAAGSVSTFVALLWAITVCISRRASRS
jgi:hypothetical protein